MKTYIEVSFTHLLESARRAGEEREQSEEVWCNYTSTTKGVPPICF